MDERLIIMPKHINQEDAIVRIPESGCWIWTGPLSHDGYPRFKQKYAHRIIYEQVNGGIQKGLTLDHVCRVRCCVNPAHLEPMTLAENIKRGNYGWRKHLTHCKRGHELSGYNLIVNKKGGRVCRICSNASVRKYQLKNKSNNI